MPRMQLSSSSYPAYSPQARAPTQPLYSRNPFTGPYQARFQSPTEFQQQVKKDSSAAAAAASYDGQLQKFDQLIKQLGPPPATKPQMAPSAAAATLPQMPFANGTVNAAKVPSPVDRNMAATPPPQRMMTTNGATTIAVNGDASPTRPEYSPLTDPGDSTRPEVVIVPQPLDVSAVGPKP